MRFSLAQKDLHRMLQLASRGAADDKSPVPALSHIHIAVRNGRVRCEATDISSAVAIEAPVSLEYPFDPGEILAPKDLIERVGAMPEGLIQLRLEGQHQILLTSHTAPRKYLTAGLVTDWTNNLKWPETFLTIPAATLLRLLSTVEHAISTDEAKALASCAFIEWTTGAISAVSTDGHRLAYVKLDVEGIVPNPTGTNSMLIRRDDVKLFRNLAEQAIHDGVKDIQLHHGREMAGLAYGEMRAMVKVTDGTFLPWQQVVPPTWKRRFVIDRAKLMETINAVMLTDREILVLEVKAGAKEVCLSAAAAASGDAGDAVDVALATIDNGTDAAFSLKVSPKYMKDALGTFDGEKVTLFIAGDGRDQVNFARGDETCATPVQATHLTVIMPMK